MGERSLKALRATLKNVLRRLLPHRIDTLLYSMPSDLARALPESVLPIRRYTANQPSGVASLDRRLSSSREYYLVVEDGALAHWTWLHWSVRLPRQCGFDSGAPVVADSYTNDEFRGRGIYPEVLRHIARDVALRRTIGCVYGLVAPTNDASIRGLEKAGFKRVARLKGTRIVGLLVRKRIEG
jgi:GNAT superfamily N-acetyltransferase